MRFEGVVVRGEGLGRKLGIPTANISLAGSVEPPAKGVWAVEVDGYGKAVCNIGVRPTVSGDSRLTVEVHIPGFSGDLYGKTLAVTLVRKLRDEKKFSSLDELKAQISRDIAEVLQ